MSESLRDRIPSEKIARREAIWRWVRQLQRKCSLDESIDRVKARLQGADAEDKDSFTFELKLLLTSASFEDPARAQEALALIETMIEQKPDDVRYPISKATLYLYSLSDPEKALECIDFALERAFRTRFFLREALGTKARILLELGRGEELGRILEQIMSVDGYREIPDVGKERDFVDRAPPGLIPAEIVERYNKYHPMTQRAQVRSDWLDKLRNELPLEQMIDQVRSRIQEADIEDRSHLAYSLGRVCTEAGRYDEALQWLDRSMEWGPDDARPAIQKANVLLTELDLPEKALAAIEPAIAKAFRVRAFRRQALGVKARILLRLGRCAELGPLLEQIMSLKKNPEDPDIGRERDFVDEAPAGAIPQHILARYDEFCPMVPPQW